MKTLKKILSFLTVICCLTGSLMPLQAAETEAEDIPRITFTNEPKMEANLYVIKTAPSGQTLPDSERNREFTFTLKLGGGGSENVAGEVTYHKFGADGNEILVDLLDSNGNAVLDSNQNPKKTYPKTSSYGRFTLKFGERAEFRSAEIEGLRSGTYYEVTEDVPTNYNETAYSGNAHGYVADNGTTLSFVNQYGNRPNAGLEVQKDISRILVGRTEYTIPEFLLPEQGFKFRLLLGQEKAVGEPFRIVDGEGNTVDNGVTDANGIFFVPGNCKAVFEGGSIGPNMDYEVQELALNGEASAYWSPVGNTGMEDFQPDPEDTETVIARKWGSTSGNSLAYFKNATAAFGVSKKMEDGTVPNEEFTFELTDSNSTAIGNAPYLVYEGDTLLTAQACRTTGNDGRFTLRANQMAVFLGMGIGTGYNVCEVRTEEQDNWEEQYIQVTPDTLEGYTDKSVPESFEVLPFENKPLTGGLFVRKAVVNEDGEASFDRKTEFKFTLYKVGIIEDYIDATRWERVKNAYYVIERDGEEYTDDTGNDGVFYLKANETAMFTRLPSGIYVVQEDISDVPEYSVSPEEGNTDKTIDKKTSYIQGETVGLTFTNYYIPKRVDLILKKVDAENKPLAGAEFELYRNEAETNQVTALMAAEDGAVYIVGVENQKDGAGMTGDTGDDTVKPGTGEADMETTGGTGDGTVKPGTGEDGMETMGGTGDGNTDSGTEDKGSDTVWKKTYTTPENGILEIQGLKPGTYYLRETKAPSGYILLPEPIKIEIHWKGGDGDAGLEEKTLEVVVDNGKHNQAAGGQITVNTEAENQVKITVVNSELYELPSSGGMGIYWYLIGGILLMTGAVLILYKNKMAGEVQRD